MITKTALMLTEALPSGLFPISTTPPVAILKPEYHKPGSVLETEANLFRELSSAMTSKPQTGPDPTPPELGHCIPCHFSHQTTYTRGALG